MMIEAKIYSLSSTGKNIYYIDLETNSIQYASQINVYKIPTSATATSNGHTIPTGATWTYPVTAVTPTITFNAGFGSLIGMPASTLPADTSIDSQTLSSFSPEISVVNSILLTCNLVSNIGVSIPHDSFFSTGLSASYGEQIRLNPYPVWSEVRNAHYQYIELTLYDQNLNLLNLYDTDGNITLAIIDDDNKNP
jgi:hypothetical protein